MIGTVARNSCTVTNVFYKYFVTVTLLKSIFLIPVLYFTVYFSDYFLFLLIAFLHKYLYFLHFQTRLITLVLMDHHSITNLYIMNRLHW